MNSQSVPSWARRVAGTALAASAVLLAAVVASGCATSRGAGTGSHFRGPTGLQLYSLRAQFTRNVPETVNTVQAFGIQEVELAGTYNWKPAAFRDLLLSKGLKPVSAHTSYERYRDKIDDVIAESKELGLKYTGLAWIPHKGAFTEADAREAIKVFNAAGAALKKQGIQFFYHVHGYEFQPYGDGTLLDLIIKETDPANVAFEMDVVWVFFPGQDPVQWLKKYPGRFQLMHLKDLKKGVARGSLSGGTDPNNDVVLGTGQIDWPPLLREAQRQGIKHYFIEDESADSVNQIPQTLRFLEQVKW